MLSFLHPTSNIPFKKKNILHFFQHFNETKIDVSNNAFILAYTLDTDHSHIGLDTLHFTRCSYITVAIFHEKGPNK